MRFTGCVLLLSMASACSLWDDRRKQAEEEARRAAEQAVLSERKAKLAQAASGARPDQRDPLAHDEAQRAVDSAEKSAGAPSSNAAPSSSTVPSADASGGIDRLVARLDKDHFWRNGHFAKIPLPATANPEEVLGALLEATIFDRGKVKTHTARESREVHIGGGTYVAMSIDTDLGPKIVLMQYAGEKVGWWTRVFDPE